MIGLSAFGSAWLCALASFGVSTEDKVGGLNFILGRIVGLMFLGLAIATIGFFADIPPVFFVIAFGILSILFGLLVIVQITGLTQRFPGFLRLRRNRDKEKRLHESNPAWNGPLGHKKGKCRGGWKDGYKMRRFKNSYAFGLGFARGATPCLKVMVLVPLLVSVDIFLATAIILVYALASTVYPVIGFLSGNLLRSAKRHALYVKIAAAMTLVGIGVYSIVNVLMTSHPIDGI